jgi:conjugal transfer ATP-binding protein TraC
MDQHSVEQARQAKNWFEVCDFVLKEDVMFTGPAFQQQLPFNASPEMVEMSKRYHTMMSKHSAHIIPVIGDWKGNGVGANEIFFSRRGQIQLWCPFDSETNMNGFIAGDSGAGKSVFAQGVIFNLWSRGTIVRIIDSGRSYIKLTQLVKGEFIEFSDSSQLVINPFTDIKDIIKELPPLIGVLEQMCAPKDGLSDFQSRMLEKYTLQTFYKLGNEMTITDLSEALLSAGRKEFDDSGNEVLPGTSGPMSKADELDMSAACLDANQISEIQKIGHQLFPFTRHGIYGSFFNGAANLTMSGDWSVLELDDLRELPELQTIVLMMLVIKMNRDYYLAPRSYKKILAIDEAWRFLGSEGSDIDGAERIQKYIIGSFRLFRKLNASIIIITQSPLDLSPDGNSPIVQNAANIILLQQKPATIETLRRHKVLDITDFEYDLLKSVHTSKGKYSEAFFYTSGRGHGIGRYILDRFVGLLTSTDAKDVSGVDRYIDQGMSIGDAIQAYMNEESRRRAA